jgi:hypothetical protein
VLHVVGAVSATWLVVGEMATMIASPYGWRSIWHISKCLNDAARVDGADSFTCICAAGY